MPCARDELGGAGRPSHVMSTFDIPYKVGRGNSEHISVRDVWQRSFGVNTQAKSVRLGRQTDVGLMKMYIAFRTVIP